MPNETHKLQNDPPEGRRDVVERELKRQSSKPEADKQKSATEGKDKKDEEAPSKS